MRSLRTFMMYSLAGLAAVVALASWYDRINVLRAAEDRVESIVRLLLQHALNAFQMQELVHQQIKLRAAGLGWEAISRSDELASFLQETRDRMSQISSIWMADTTGHVRASSGLPYPGSLTFENRDDFRTHRGGQHGMFVGEQHLGTFALSWRKSSSTGGFDGVIGIEVGVQYFENFFRGLDTTGHQRAVLVRTDGTVLAASPGTDEPKRFPPTSGLMQSIASGIQNDKWNVSPNGITHFFRWRQLDPYPVYVAYAVDKNVALGAWYWRTAFYAILGLVLWAALCLIAHLTSRRAAAEAALQQARKMEAVGQLASGVAHDFNNVLTAVIGNVERITLDRDTTRPVRRFAEAALRAAHRGSSLTAQLLAFARQQPLHPKALRMDELLDTTLPVVKDAVGEAINVTSKLGSDLAAIRIDPGQFEAALLNLALNARDAMPDGGTLRIEARNVIIEKGNAERLAIPPGDYVVIEIGDTGAGMPAATARRAFEPFFTTKEAGKGTGLGLAMVYGFVRQSGGTAEIGSGNGNGTMIKLYFPSSETPVASAPLATAAHSEMSRTASILVVEDQDELGQLLADSLEEFGHEVRTARAAEEAIDILRRNARIEVLVTDLILPGVMTGLDLVRQARELRPDLKILAISGNASEASIRASSLDHCAFLAKPFRPSDLTKTVSELLSEAAEMPYAHKKSHPGRSPRGPPLPGPRTGSAESLDPEPSEVPGFPRSRE
jgi:signal transduction histidine kinase/ActR/RegA family two-component response regulator